MDRGIPICIHICIGSILMKFGWVFCHTINYRTYTYITCLSTSIFDFHALMDFYFFYFVLSAHTYDFVFDLFPLSRFRHNNRYIFSYYFKAINTVVYCTKRAEKCKRRIIIIKQYLNVHALVFVDGGDRALL